MCEVSAHQELSIQSNEMKLYHRDCHQSIETKRVKLMKKISTMANSDVDTIP